MIRSALILVAALAAGPVLAQETEPDPSAVYTNLATLYLTVQRCHDAGQAFSSEDLDAVFAYLQDKTAPLSDLSRPERDKIWATLINPGGLSALTPEGCQKFHGSLPALLEGFSYPDQTAGTIEHAPF